jgi:hypothetical protein
VPSRAPRLLRAYVAHAQLAVSCVGQMKVLYHEGAGASAEVWIAPRKAPVATVGGGKSSIGVRQELEAMPSGIHVARYSYQVFDSEGVEFVAYHRHGGRHDYDHVHVAAAGLGPLALPTGQVSLDMFTRGLIDAFEIRPARPDWRTVLG